MSFPQPAEAPNWPLEAAREAAAEEAAKMSGKDDFGRRAFLRMVSHELRTPLNSIIGFSDILNQELYGPLGSPQYVEYAGIIRDSGKKLLSLFNNVLDIVRLEGGGGLAPMNEPVLPIIEEAIAKLRPQATAGGVTLYNRVADEDLHAWLDPRGLVSCLDHLLRNAIEFSPAGEIVEINARRTDGHVILTVFNRGDAPDQGDVERLMKPFEQGENAENRRHEGAGLGWAVVRLNAEAMGGAFGVVSRKGEALKAIIRLKAA
ncbi:sensor histidine kinase [Asticcacaulis taihuensis]|jgi:signal transduction histidine kinase|uniref:sensor histidine kinase n=1 Tax=Asticcacaulis taihuensis TaxID=260084 RepID=UPI0026F347F6|nr:HAMP domain-containing sensor histidine kinase [Asticcacaulis taihuensis]